MYFSDIFIILIVFSLWFSSVVFAFYLYFLNGDAYKLFQRVIFLIVLNIYGSLVIYLYFKNNHIIRKIFPKYCLFGWKEYV